MTKNVTCLNGELKIGDSVISVLTEEYGGLIGTVYDIKLLDDPDRDTENETHDIYVDFRNDYSPNREAEILSEIRELYCDPQKEWDDCALDSVIMSPDMLLRLPEHIDKDVYNWLLDSKEAVTLWCVDALIKTITEIRRNS